MKHSNAKHIKSVVSAALILALVFSLGASALAAGPGSGNSYGYWSDDNTSAGVPSAGNGGSNPTGGYSDDYSPYGGYGYYDGYGYDDYSFFGYGDDYDDLFWDYYAMFYDEDFDIDEFLKDVDDADLKAEIKELYEAYLKAYKEYLEADDKLYDAEDALLAALMKINGNDEKKTEGKADEKPGSDKKDDKQDAKEAQDGDKKVVMAVSEPAPERNTEVQKHFNGHKL